MTDPAQLLAAQMKPSLDKLRDEILEAHLVRHQELTLAIQGLKAQLALFEQIISSQKKKTPSKKAAATEGAETIAADGSIVPAVKLPAPPAKKFATNMMIYFKSMWGKDEAFTQRYTSPALEAALNSDATIAAITAPIKRANKIADVAWKWLSANDKPKCAAMRIEYDAAKALHAQKAAQETVEADTPEGTPAE